MSPGFYPRALGGSAEGADRRVLDAVVGAAGRHLLDAQRHCSRPDPGGSVGPGVETAIKQAVLIRVPTPFLSS